MKIRSIILLSLFSLFLLSCEKFLEEKPYSFLTPDNFPKNAEDGRIALNGAYNVFKKEYIRGYYHVLANIADTDIGTYGSTRNDNYGTYSNFFRTSADAFPHNVWMDLYTGINGCNFVIDIVQKKDFKGGDKLVAEARALRAFFYMELVNYFGDVPLKVHNTESTSELKLPRSPVPEIWDLCVQDLDYAEEVMEKYPADFAKTDNGGLLTLGAVRMIKAHLYMYMAGKRRTWDGNMVDGNPAYWSKVRDLCQSIIGMNIYKLDADFTNVFKDLYLNKFNLESIWEIDFQMPNYGSIFSNLTAPTYGAGHAGGFANMRSTIDFWNTFHVKDTRRGWTLGSGTFTNYTYTEAATVNLRPYINKFRKVAGNGNHAWTTPGNVPVYRFAEVHLMLAEALNEINQGPNQEACDAINKVRYRARPTANKTDGTVLPDLTTTLNYDAFKTAIINERAHELGFEGLRRMDIIRWGIYMDRIKMVGDAKYTMTKASNVREYHMLMPIPQQEWNRNPQWKQNIGW